MISVCMTTYNGEKYIKEQLKSILAQITENDEVIIYDDNSKDSTIKIIRHFNDTRIKLYVNNHTVGYTKNFERSLKKASGDIIFLSDQDDIWINDKVSVSMNYLKKSDFVVSDSTIVDKDLNLIKESHFTVYNTKKGFITNLLFPRYVGACMAFKRDVLLKSLPFPENSKLIAHDYWICLIAEAHFRTSLIKKPLILYRRHQNNTSTGGNRSKNTLKHKIHVRLYAIYYLIKVLFR